MIYGIGVDLIKVERMREAVDRWGEKFLRRVFTEKELARCRRARDPHLSMAVRFAAKEALIKAVGMTAGAAFTDIEVLNDELGKPYITVKGKLQVFFKIKEISKAHLSLSHEKEYGVASVVLEKKTVV
ncbi:MAG: holo-ACP synthase [Nitrospirota bacterium]|jgi:holo-[acyl-carrier protein] synthase